MGKEIYAISPTGRVLLKGNLKSVYVSSFLSGFRLELDNGIEIIINDGAMECLVSDWNAEQGVQG